MQLVCLLELGLTFQRPVASGIPKLHPLVGLVCPRDQQRRIRAQVVCLPSRYAAVVCKNETNNAHPRKSVAPLVGSWFLKSPHHAAISSS